MVSDKLLINAPNVHSGGASVLLDIFLKELKSSLLAGGRKRSRVLRGQAPEHGTGCPRAADAAPQPV
jgi:hypothetical protein